MTKANVQQSSSGVGFFGLLTILFIGLKLTGYITWSWWWVLAPLLIPFAILFMVFLIAVLFVGVGYIFNKK